MSKPLCRDFSRGGSSTGSRSTLDRSGLVWQGFRAGEAQAAAVELRSECGGGSEGGVRVGWMGGQVQRGVSQGGGRVWPGTGDSSIHPTWEGSFPGGKGKGSAGIQSYYGSTQSNQSTPSSDAQTRRSIELRPRERVHVIERRWSSSFQYVPRRRPGQPIRSPYARVNNACGAHLDVHRSRPAAAGQVIPSVVPVYVLVPVLVAIGSSVDTLSLESRSAPGRTDGDCALGVGSRESGLLVARA